MFKIKSLCMMENYKAVYKTFFVEYNPSFVDPLLINTLGFGERVNKNEKQIVAKVHKCHRVNKTKLTYTLDSANFKLIDHFPEQRCDNRLLTEGTEQF